MAGHPITIGPHFSFYFLSPIGYKSCSSFPKLIFKILILPLAFLNISHSYFSRTTTYVLTKINILPYSYKSQLFPSFPKHAKIRDITSSPPLEHSSSNVQLTLWGLMILRGGFFLSFKIFPKRYHYCAPLRIRFLSIPKYLNTRTFQP